jgi:hypothetical protein
MASTYHQDMAMVDWHTESAEAWAAAQHLADALADGDDLPQIETSLHLADDEIMHAGINADCSWYGDTEATYQHRRFLVFGGIGTLGLTAAASAIGNHRRRNTAAALSRPQWRSLGSISVLLTSRRILLTIDDTFTSVWLDDILQATPAADGQRLELTCRDHPPFSIHGDWVPYFTVALSHLLQ